MKKVRDSQKQKVYDWGFELKGVGRTIKHKEKQYYVLPKLVGAVRIIEMENRAYEYSPNNPLLSVEECEDLVRKALTWWFRLGNQNALKNGRTVYAHGRNIGAPRIRINEHAYSFAGRSSWGRSELVFTPGGLRKDTILHEISHYIISTHGLHWYDGGHGPYFMRVFIELMGHYMKSNRSELTRSAKKNKIKVHPMSKIDRPKPRHREG